MFKKILLLLIIFGVVIPLVSADPYAGFTADSVEGVAPLTVNFTDMSTGATAWNWTFQDIVGNNTVISFSTSQNPQWIFNAGNFSIVLNASNGTSFNISPTLAFINVSGATPTPTPTPTPVPSGAPYAAFNATPNPTSLSTTVYFVDLSANGPTSWYWDFGDGDFSTNQNTSHLYSTIATYNVTLNATNGCGSSLFSQFVTIYPDSPRANFTVTPNVGANPLLIGFNDTSTGMCITAWSWDFGDGGSSTLQNPTHTYVSLGTYSPRLTVYSSVGDNVSQPVPVYVVSSPVPMVDFIGAPIVGSPPLSVQFTDLSAALGGVNGWNWSFGDGTYSNAQNPVHIYSSSGTYSVTLVATNAPFSNYSTKGNYINVGGLISPVTANFIATPLSSSGYPATIQFTDQSSCSPSCNQWVWDFNNDGSVDSVQQSPAYTYTYPGTYSVRLIASNGINNGMKIRNSYITIGPVFVPTTIPQPTGTWHPGYQYNGSNGAAYQFKGDTSIDLPNSTFLKYWLQNFSATGNFSVYGFATGLMAPIMHVFGFWIFLIIWGLYLFAVWIRSQDVTMPLIIGILSMGTFGLLFPKESLPVIIIMFVICGAIILTKLMKE